MPKLRIYFSDFFNVSPEKIKEYGAFNISLINDLPLFIDQFLLFNNEKYMSRVIPYSNERMPILQHVSWI